MSDEELAAYAKRLRGLKGFAAQAAKEAAPRVERVVKATAAAGTDPEGKAWPLKRDGGRALPNAADAISVTARGAIVIVRLVGAYVYHNRAKGSALRRILPDSAASIPINIRDEIRAAMKDVFERMMK